MMDTTTTPVVGDLATVAYGAGRTTSDTPSMVVEVSTSGRSLVAHGVYDGGFTADRATYTLRKNGRYARKGGGQWDEFLRFRTGVR